ncbi:xanthine dehydrogenase family protein molybdopterin-binding subunit [Paraburkholderia hospita]|uniref:Xanthine dehydrogenase family protein molybdopterin-binding subunit n=1 Tax=Paraburkholderia hospita TaxID=169430 RepID=A0AAN1JMR4_9BURK|nr:xanthine dehydrogenase family protein molybdopterin-binding subunit [Paraburkholderia hospita]AUT76805.1 xanthine dehydrogenase family protein molybdopterin-binding subunit [Paraburkholderia hospita]OUL92218.1 carbon monoxide dehydrogenase [Paraburkholderia hospita]SEI26011.1 isoquinoline 1-oxidoreductase, beta subunit [Paraburkholderia hospita]
MLPEFDYSEMPRALQHLLTSGRAGEAATLPRRSFLKLAGAGGLALGVFPYLAIGQTGGSGQTASALKPTQQPSAFVQIAPDGEVTVTINRLEFGQGVQTALPMILAEELDADWNLVRSRQGSNDAAYVDPLFGIHLTGGSHSVKNSFTQYRELGARVRAMLLSAAAARWKVDVATLNTRAGIVLGSGGRKLSYGELAEAAMALPVPERVTLKNPRDFRIIGRPTTRLDAQAKSSGRQDFGIDTHLPGQLTAVVAHPPVFGARLTTVDDSATRAIKGVKAVLRVPLDRGGEGVAVVADGYWPARQGRAALKLQWDTASVEKVDSEQLLSQYRELAGRPGPRQFDADMTPLAAAPHQLEAEFVFPYLAHAPMEPLNCTVQLSEGRAELWVGTQCAGLDGVAAARAVGLKPEQVKVHVQTAGGGFGRRFAGTSDYVVEACEVAKAVRSAGLNAPVRTLWSREDDIRGGYYRPIHLHRARIGFDARGKVLAWDHVIVGQSITSGTVFEQFQVKNGIDATATEGMRGPYPLPMRLTVHHPTPNVPVLWWRSVGSTHTAFVMETLLDDIARTTKQDPVAYRMRLFGDRHPRHRAALQLAVDRSGYGKKPLPTGRAWGVAVHESFDSVVAYVVEASVQEGRPVLHRVIGGVHCNLAVNPRSVEAQVQGAAVMGLSMCLPGAAITLKNGEVEQSNFGDFTVARITDIPEFDVHIVPSADAPTGMGEPGLPPLAPAFANAIASLTGKPQRQLPFNPA